MSKQTRKQLPDLEVTKVVPAEVVELKRAPRTNQTLVTMLKTKYDQRREILFYCECSHEPTDCRCENQQITVQFESDLYLGRKDVIEVVLPIPPSVYLPTPPYYCICAQPSEKCFNGTCTNMEQLSYQ